MTALANQFGWSRMALVGTNEAVMRQITEAAKDALEHSGKVVFFHLIESTVSGSIVNEANLQKQKQVIKNIKQEVRIIMLFMYQNDFRNFLISAYDENMLNGDYVIIGSDFEYLLYTKQTYRPKLDDVIYNGVINRSIRKGSGPIYQKFLQDVIKDFQHPNFDSYPHLSLDADPGEIDFYAGKDLGLSKVK